MISDKILSVKKKNGLRLQYKNSVLVSMQDGEISPEGLEFQPGTRLAFTI